MPGFSQALNTDVNGKLTSSVYDTNLSQWLQHTGNCLQTAGGLWVFQKGDAGGNAVIVGAAADNTAAAGNPVQMGGRYSAADPALDDGDIGFIRVNSKGEPLVELTGRAAVKTATLVDSGGGVYNLSGEVNLEGYQYFTIYVPATWTGTAITLQSAPTSGGTFVDVYNDAGIEVSLTVAASSAVTIDVNALNLASLRYVKFRSGTAATPTNESSAKVLTISCKS